MKRCVLFVLIFSLLGVIGCVQGQGEPIELPVKERPTEFGWVLEYPENNKVYYTETVTKEEAEDLGDYLVDAMVFGTGNETQVQLHKGENAWEVRITIIEDKIDDEVFLETMKLLVWGITYDVYAGALVDVHLCDNNFNTLSKINITNL